MEKEFLLSELANCSAYTLTNEDRKALVNVGIENVIFQKLTSKKFRKWAIQAQTIEHVRNAIHHAVGHDKPLEIRLPFAGVKLWRLDSAPEVDWAEFFAISYYIRYLAPVCTIYKPGVSLIFSSDDMVMEKMNNIPQNDLRSYQASFRVLIESFRQHLPENFNLDIVSIGELYPDQRELKQELTQLTRKINARFDKSSDDLQENMISGAAFNVLIKGVKDFTGIGPDKKYQLFKRSFVMHEAYRLLRRRHEFNRGVDVVTIYPVVNGKAIAVGTTKSSVTKFWTGQGVLERRHDEYVPRILSPSQINKSVHVPHMTIPTDIFELKNLREINVYTYPLL